MAVFLRVLSGGTLHRSPRPIPARRDPCATNGALIRTVSNSMLVLGRPEMLISDNVSSCTRSPTANGIRRRFEWRPRRASLFEYGSGAPHQPV